MTTAIDILGSGIGDHLKSPDSFVGMKFGHCLIQSRLKDGGQGYSFLAWDNEVKKERVIKISRSSYLDDDSEENCNFEREGIILARLRHPQIVDMIEQGKVYGHRYMIIDFINGHDFGKVLKVLHKKKRELNAAWHKILDPATALAITASALEPLAYAHKVKIQLPGEGLVEGLAHRDISSSNLLLGMGHEYGGLVHIIDFGIAKTNFQQSITLNTNIIGTVRYLSPMRLMIKPDNAHKSVYWRDFKQTQYDAHSMGCFLYELLTGESFINFPDIQQCLAAICNPETYKQFAVFQIKHFDRRIQTILKKAIVFPGQKHSENQYKNAVEMLADVNKVYNKLTGGRPVKESVKSFSECIENLDDIVKEIDGKSSRVIRYTTRVNIAQTRPRKKRVGALLLFLTLLVISGSMLYFLLGNNLPGEGTAVQQNEVEPPAPQVAGDWPGRGQKPPTDAPAGKSKKFSRKRLTTIPSLKQGFGQLQELLRVGNTTKAYAKVNELLKLYNDPALLVVKADLLRRRSPASPRIEALLKRADGRHSRLLSTSEMQRRIQTLRRP